MYCKNCGELLNQGVKFCSNCGFKVGDGQGFCDNCGVKVSGATCDNCGNIIANNNEEIKENYYNNQNYNTNHNNYNQNQQKSKIVAGILGILVGGFGIHRFYLGYVGIGILQIIVTILTFGAGSIWGFIEGILILCDSTITTDADGVPLSKN